MQLINYIDDNKWDCNNDSVILGENHIPGGMDVGLMTNNKMKL